MRGREFFQDVEAVVDDLQARGIKVTMLFLDAQDAVLVRRFEGSRRPHPLQGEGTLLEGITKEREVLKALRERADFVIDTSSLNVHELRERIASEVGHQDEPLRVNVVSFGFKNGIPADADYVVDVRFLHNPHWVPDLRPLTGLDTAVKDYVLKADGAMAFVEGYADLLDMALTRYRAHDKHSVTVAVGCTGGKHRSVAVSEELAARLADKNFSVRVTHRDKELT